MEEREEKKDSKCKNGAKVSLRDKLFAGLRPVITLMSLTRYRPAGGLQIVCANQEICTSNYLLYFKTE